MFLSGASALLTCEKTRLSQFRNAVGWQGAVRKVPERVDLKTRPLKPMSYYQRRKYGGFSGQKFYCSGYRAAVSSVMQNLILKVKSLRDTRAQDLIEYALMAAFVAVAAGAIMPGVASSISTIFSKVASVMEIASTQG